MIRKIIILTYILVCSLLTFSQTSNLLQEGVEKQIEISNTGFNTGNFNKQVLSIISNATGKSIGDVKLQYKVKEHRSVIKKTDKLEIKIAIGNFVFLDDILYQKFSINQFLAPDLISYSYVWEDNTGNVLKSESVKHSNFKNGTNLFKETINDVYNYPDYKLYLKEFSFGFSQSKYDKLEAFVNKVDEYYNADARLNMVDQELDKIKFDTLEILEPFRQQTIDNVKTFNQIKSKRFASKLDLDANDPIQFRSHLGRVEVRNRDIKKELERILDNMHEAYYKKGLDWIKWMDEAKAKDFFERSIGEKNNYAPPYLELAKIEYSKGNLIIAIDTCAKIIETMAPDTDTRYNTVKLAEAIIYKWIALINKNLESLNVELATEIFSRAQRYAQNIKGVKYFSEFDDIRKSLVVYAYKNMIQQTKVFIGAEKLQLAHNKLDSAAAFRGENRAYIVDTKTEINLQNLLFEAWVEKGRKYLNNQQPDSAFYACTQASILCQKYIDVNCSEELELLQSDAVKARYDQIVLMAYVAVQNEWADSALVLLQQANKLCSVYKLTEDSRVGSLLVNASQIKYGDLILAGDDAAKYNRNREALAFYEEASDIENKIEIEKNAELSRKIKKVVASYILVIANDVDSFVDALKLNEARDKFNVLESMAMSYNVNDDSVIVDIISSLKTKLLSGKCDKAAYNYSIQISAAKKFIEKKDFVLAAQALKKAKVVALKNADCNLNNQERKAIENEIRAMLHYQKKMDQIDVLLGDKEFIEVIDNYIILSKFYRDSCTNNFGIEHLDLFDYLVTHKNGQLVDYAIQYYLSLTKIDEAFKLLKELYQRDYIASWSKESQTMLGANLARLDNSNDSADEINPRIKVLEYTKENKWFRFLKKAYIKEWKNLM